MGSLGYVAKGITSVRGQIQHGIGTKREQIKSETVRVVGRRLYCLPPYPPQCTDLEGPLLKYRIPDRSQQFVFAEMVVESKSGRIGNPYTPPLILYFL